MTHFLTALATSLDTWTATRPDELTIHLTPPEPTVPGLIVTAGPDGLTYRFDQPEAAYPLEDAAVQRALAHLLHEGSQL